MVAAGLLESRENPWILVSLDRYTPGGGEGSHEAELPTAKPMHISTVFYSGLEGLGGLDMQNEPVSQVRCAFSGYSLLDMHSLAGFLGF